METQTSEMETGKEHLAAWRHNLTKERIMNEAGISFEINRYGVRILPLIPIWQRIEEIRNGEHIRDRESRPKCLLESAQ